MAIKLYTAPNTYGCLLAKVDDAIWSIFPAVAGGWASRRDWQPAPAYARHIEEAHNGIEYIYHANISETKQQMLWLGFSEANIPAEASHA